MVLENRASYLATAAVIAGAALALVVLGLSHHLHRASALVLLAFLAFAAAAALLGWRRAAQTVAAVAAIDREERDELEADLESSLAEQRQELERQRKAYGAEHDWNRELRQTIMKLQHERGALGDADDTAKMILRVAIRLLGAEKGLLLSRQDVDCDGDLDMVAAEGFEHDPEHSHVVQRFAREVIASDETIRDDSIPDHTSTADAEIDNLVAIPIYMQDKFNGVVIACNKPDGFREYDDQVLLALGDHAGAVLQNSRLHGLLRGSYLTTVSMLADAVQAKDPFLRGHSEEVARFVANVADRLGFAPERREQLLFASLLHDVGKIGVSERILLKPAGLTEEEREVIEMHPRIGHRLVQQVPALRPMALGILHHHERWDGAGYPSGLDGETIPVEARIIAVADTFSAMTTDRPYRARISAEDACRELERCAGSQFDPEIVRLFVREVRRMPAAVREIEREESIRDLELALDDEPLLGFGSYALVDNLTLLASRRHIHELAETEAARATIQGRPYAMLLVKLLAIDRINREDGYAAGDAAIQRVARVVERMAGRCGGTAARFSGACLALLVPGAREEIAEQLLEELGSDLSEETSVRIAVASWQRGDSGEAVVDRAVRRLSSATPA